MRQKKERAKKAKAKVLKRRQQAEYEKAKILAEESEFEKLSESQPKQQTIRYGPGNPRPMSHKKRQKILKKIEANNKLLEFLEKSALEEAKADGQYVGEKLEHEKFINFLHNDSKDKKVLNK